MKYALPLSAKYLPFQIRFGLETSSFWNYIWIRNVCHLKMFMVYKFWAFQGIKLTGPPAKTYACAVWLTHHLKYALPLSAKYLPFQIIFALEISSFWNHIGIRNVCHLKMFSWTGLAHLNFPWLCKYLKILISSCSSKW